MKKRFLCIAAVLVCLICVVTVISVSTGIPFGSYTYTTTLTDEGPEEVQDYFLTSVAKGATVTLPRAFQQKVPIEVTGDAPYDPAALGEPLTAACDTTDEFEGPPEASSDNSRTYYVRFYVQKKSWTQTRFLNGKQDGVEAEPFSFPPGTRSFSSTTRYHKENAI